MHSDNRKQLKHTNVSKRLLAADRRQLEEPEYFKTYWKQTWVRTDAPIQLFPLQHKNRQLSHSPLTKSHNELTGSPILI